MSGRFAMISSLSLIWAVQHAAACTCDCHTQFEGHVAPSLPQFYEHIVFAEVLAEWYAPADDAGWMSYVDRQMLFEVKHRDYGPEQKFVLAYVPDGTSCSANLEVGSTSYVAVATSVTGYPIVDFCSTECAAYWGHFTPPGEWGDRVPATQINPSTPPEID